jgi:hypothetical protein
MGCAVVGGLVVAGCGSDGSPADRAASQSDKLGNQACGCWAAFGYDSQEACQSEFAVSEDAVQCANEAYDQYPMELGPFFDCFEMAARDARNCMSSLSCEELEQWQTCFEQFEDEINSCPDPSTEAENALGECGEVVEDDMSM